jgi:NADH dehydrogenase/NADH:ubiquinone oxidoreductase subunit G
VVLTAGDEEESQEEFDALIEDLENDYQPVGVLEEMLVQAIATALWRKARILRAENGEIRLRLDAAAAERMRRNSDKGNFALASQEMGSRLYNPENQTDQKISTMDRWTAAQVAQSHALESEPGIEYLAALLRGAKSEIQGDGYISENLRKKIFSIACFWDYGFALVCLNATPARAGMKDPSSTTEMSNADVVDILEDRLQRLGARKEYAIERETLAEDAEARSFSLPSDSATDKLLRYEAHVDRQLIRNMDQLERLQRRRKGENVPPPLNINMGRRS